MSNESNAFTPVATSVDTARAAPNVLSDDVRSAEIKAQEAEAKAADAAKTPEQRKADKARADADDARAQAAAEQRLTPVEPMDVVEAKVMAPVDPEMRVTDHLAQKFGNDPENPKPAPGKEVTEDGPKVRLSRKTPDHPDLVYGECHPDMVGDHLRAGWEQV